MQWAAIWLLLMMAGALFVCNCSKLLNACAPDSIDERVLNTHAEDEVVPADLAARHHAENLALFLDAAKGLGVNLGDATPDDLLQGKVCCSCACSPFSVSSSNSLFDNTSNHGWA